jgi:cytochrome c551/c552
MKSASRILIAFALLLPLASCGSKTSSSGNGAAATDTAATPPAATPPADTSSAAVPTGPSPYDSGPRAAESPVNATLAAEGKTLFTSKGCVTCHAFGKRVIGPDLAGVTHRRTATWIEHQILHPEVMIQSDPITMGLVKEYKVPMTNQKLTQAQALAVIEHLKQMDRSARP